MKLDDWIEFAALLGALSAASQRLVDIIKGIFEWLAVPKTNSVDEGKRNAAILTLTVIAGFVSAWLIQSLIKDVIGREPSFCDLMGIGFLSAAGSTFWNAIFDYFKALKRIKVLQVEEGKARIAALNRALPAQVGDLAQLNAQISATLKDNS